MPSTVRAAAVGFTLCLVGALTACRADGGLVLNQLVEARTLTADIRTAFLKAYDKSSEAVMAETDEY